MMPGVIDIMIGEGPAARRCARCLDAGAASERTLAAELGVAPLTEGTN